MQNRFGWTAAHYAVSKPRLSSMKLLIEYDANMNIENHCSKVPLDYCYSAYKENRLKKIVHDIKLLNVLS